MKRFFLSTTVLALAAAAPLAQATQGVGKNEIVLGSIQDLSGPLAGYGKQLRLGMTLHVPEHHKDTFRLSLQVHPRLGGTTLSVEQAWRAGQSVEIDSRLGSGGDRQQARA